MKDPSLKLYWVWDRVSAWKRFGDVDQALAYARKYLVDEAEPGMDCVIRPLETSETHGPVTELGVPERREIS